MTEQTTSLQNIPLFQALTLEEIRILDDYLNHQDIAAGETVFNEGDKGDYVCFVLRGSLAVIKKNMSGKTTTVAQIHAGRSIGEMALVDSMQRSATVKGETACDLRVLHRDNFSQLLNEHPAIAAKILQYIARSLSLSLRRTSNQLADNLDAI